MTVSVSAEAEAEGALSVVERDLPSLEHFLTAADNWPELLATQVPAIGTLPMATLRNLTPPVSHHNQCCCVLGVLVRERDGVIEETCVGLKQLTLL